MTQDDTFYDDLAYEYEQQRQADYEYEMAIVAAHQELDEYENHPKEGKP